MAEKAYKFKMRELERKRRWDDVENKLVDFVYSARPGAVLHIKNAYRRERHFIHKRLGFKSFICLRTAIVSRMNRSVRRTRRRGGRWM